MSGSSPWVCICILEGGHFSIPDADADPGMIGLALTMNKLQVLLLMIEVWMKTMPITETLVYKLTKM